MLAVWLVTPEYHSMQSCDPLPCVPKRPYAVACPADECHPWVSIGADWGSVFAVAFAQPPVGSGWPWVYPEVPKLINLFLDPVRHPQQGRHPSVAVECQAFPPFDACCHTQMYINLSKTDAPRRALSLMLLTALLARAAAAQKVNVTYDGNEYGETLCVSGAVRHCRARCAARTPSPGAPTLGPRQDPRCALTQRAMASAQHSLDARAQHMCRTALRHPMGRSPTQRCSRQKAA